MLYRFRNSGPRFDLRKPVEVDKEYKAEIEEISRRGDVLQRLKVSSYLFQMSAQVILFILVSPWDFQSDKRGDIIWRYKRNQAEWLRRNGYLKI